MENKRAVLYARVSSDDRAKEGRNLDGQLAMCRQYALAKEWRIVAELAEDDRGASGAQFDLPKLNEVLELAAHREFDVLVVRELDRLARSLPKQLLVESLLAKADVEIEYVLGEYPNTPEGTFIKNVRAAIAEFERLKIVERTTRGKIVAAKAGSVLVGPKPPYGYDASRVDGKIRLHIREDEARIVRLAYAWYGQGDENGHKLSMVEIAHRLTAMGVPTYTDARPRQTGKASVRHGGWNPSAIHSMLRKTEYIGQWRYRKRRWVDGHRVARPREEQIPVEVPAIVDKALWLAVQVRRDRLRRSKRQMRKSAHLLTGHLTCGVCNTKMYGRFSKAESGTWHYYGCGDKVYKVGDQRCPSPLYRAEAVDKVVWAWVESLLADRETLDNALRAQQMRWDERRASLRGRLAQVNEQLARHETQQKALLDLYVDQELPRTTWAVHNDELEQKLRSLSQERANLTATLARGNLTEPQKARLHEFAGRLLAMLQAASDTHEAKRYIFDVINLRVVLGIDPAGNRYAEMNCRFGPPNSSITPVSLAKTMPLPPALSRGRKKRDR